MLAVGLLEMWGHQVTVAENGRIGIELWEQAEFDLILMDLQMPELDGISATQLIRQQEQERGGHIPIVAMTAHALKGDSERCFAAGMDGYISKPVRKQELFDAIQPFQQLGQSDSKSPVGPDHSHADKTSADTAAGEKTRGDKTLGDTGPSAAIPGDAHTDSPVQAVDWNIALDAVGGSTELLQQVCQIAIDELRHLADEMLQASQVQDSVRLRRAAHTIRSSARIFGSQEIDQLAGRIEGLCQHQQLAEAEPTRIILSQRLEQLVELLKQRIQSGE